MGSLDPGVSVALLQLIDCISECESRCCDLAVDGEEPVVGSGLCGYAPREGISSPVGGLGGTHCVFRVWHRYNRRKYP